MKRVERKEDMSPDGKLTLIQQDDGDMIVVVTPGEECRRMHRLSYSVEFCSPGGGGGRSRNTIQALRALMVAMERDNDGVAPEDLPVGMDFKPAKTVRQLVVALAHVVAEYHGVENGQTALGMHLLSVISQHATRQEPVDPKERILRRMAEKPEIIDELIDRLENDDIVD